MSQVLTVNFTVGAFPVGFKGNCQDFANALAERLSGTIPLGTAQLFTAQYGGPQPTTDVGPWWKNGTDLYVFDNSTGQYQPMEDQFPVGGCALWGGPGTPARFLLCQGQAVPVPQYQRLYQRIGNTWGGDGNNFNLPPCGKYIMSAGYDSISGGTFNNGATGGSNTFLLAANQLPELYLLTWQSQTDGPGGAGSSGLNLVDPTAGGAFASHNWPVYSADGQPVTQRNVPIPIQPPYQAMNLVIRYI